MLKIIELDVGVLKEVWKDIAQVFFASMFIGPMVSNTANWTAIGFGLLLSVFFWILSLIKIKKNAIIK